MTGTRYGSRVVQGEPFRVAACRDDKYSRGYQVAKHAVVKCDCGRWDIVSLNSLKKGDANGCKQCHAKSVNKTHGMSYTRAFRSASRAKSRCTNPNVWNYHNYGGRGIEFRFESIAAMAEYISQIPGHDDPGLSIDRIDNDGHYEPGNLRWADRKTQSRNRRGVNHV